MIIVIKGNNNNKLAIGFKYFPICISHNNKRPRETTCLGSWNRALRRLMPWSTSSRSWRWRTGCWRVLWSTSRSLCLASRARWGPCTLRSQTLRPGGVALPPPTPFYWRTRDWKVGVSRYIQIKTWGWYTSSWCNPAVCKVNPPSLVTTTVTNITPQQNSLSHNVTIYSTFIQTRTFT